MALYLLFLLPAFLTLFFSSRIDPFRLFWVWLFMSIPLCLLVPSGSQDFKNYVIDYDFIKNFSLDKVLAKDPLFSLTTYFFSGLGVPAVPFLLTLACLALGLKLMMVSKLSRNSPYAIILYVASYFFLHEFTEVRIAIAISIWMMGLPYLVSDKRVYFGLVLLATLVHLQVAIAFLIPFMQYLFSSKNGRVFLLLLAFGMILLSPTRIFDSLGKFLLGRIPDVRADIYLKISDMGLWVRPNPFSVISLLSLGTAGTIFRKYWKEDIEFWRSNFEITCAICLLMGVLCLALFSSVSVAALRLSEFFFSLLPVTLSFMLQDFKSKNVQLELVLLLTAVFSFIFIYHSPLLIESLGVQEYPGIFFLWLVFLFVTAVPYPAIFRQQKNRI